MRTLWALIWAYWSLAFRKKAVDQAYDRFNIVTLDFNYPCGR